MRIENNTSDKAALEELGARIAQHRLNKNFTQQRLAKEAGVSLPTLQRIEQGHSTNMTNVIRILRALKLLDNLEILTPAPFISPIMQASMQGRMRHRASSKRQEDSNDLWSWDDKK